MKSISSLFATAFNTMRERNWDSIYVLVDVHGVMMEPNYRGISTTIYSQCLEPLRLLSNDKRVKLIMWTCSNADHLDQYWQMFQDQGVVFDYINENPEVAFKDSIGDYSVKLYANVIMDDKAGFEPESDWTELLEYLQQ